MKEYYVEVMFSFLIEAENEKEAKDFGWDCVLEHPNRDPDYPNAPLSVYVEEQDV